MKKIITVKELKEELAKFDDNMPVWIADSFNGDDRLGKITKITKNIYNNGKYTKEDCLILDI